MTFRDLLVAATAKSAALDKAYADAERDLGSLADDCEEAEQEVARIKEQIDHIEHIEDWERAQALMANIEPCPTCGSKDFLSLNQAGIWHRVVCYARAMSPAACLYHGPGEETRTAAIATHNTLLHQSSKKQETA